MLDAVRWEDTICFLRELGNYNNSFWGYTRTCEDKTWPGWDGVEITSGCPSSHEIFKGFSLSPHSFLTASS